MLALNATAAGLFVPKRSDDGKAACQKQKPIFRHTFRLNKYDPKQKTWAEQGPGLGPHCLTWVSPPSPGVISVSLCTTTLVTDMSGCCSLASFMA